MLICALAIPALAGCEAGLNAPQLSFHPAANGATASAGGVTVNNAFVLGPGVGQTLPAGSQAGMFMSISATSGDQLVSVSAPGRAGSVTLDGTVNIPQGGVVNLTGPDPRIVLTNLTTPVQGGQTIPVTLTFANAAPITIQVPVMPQAFEYATFLQPPAPAPTPTPSPAASVTASASPRPSATP